METAKQFSVQWANKPGRFASILSGLNKEKVTIRAFCVMDCGNRGTLRFVPDDPALAQTALESINVDFDTADVLMVVVPNQPGGLPKICQRLAEDHLNVDYAYGALSETIGTKGGNLAVVKVNDLTKAQKSLCEIGPNHKPVKKRPGRRPTYAR